MITSKQKPSASFTAIDVEYADHEQNICQIGLAVVRDLEALLYGDGRKFFG